MRTTIKMIAERAGVSIGTVDRVLHDRPYVKAEVRERVLRVMEELDYHPNRMASAPATSARSVPCPLPVVAKLPYRPMSACTGTSPRSFCAV